MTEKQFNEIAARAANPPFGTSSQVRTDVADLIAERYRVGGEFEPEPKTEEEIAKDAEAAAAIEAAEAEKASKKGGKR